MDSCWSIVLIAKGIYGGHSSWRQWIRKVIFSSGPKRRGGSMAFIMVIILSMWWDGMDVVTLLPSAFMISSLLRGGCTSLRRYIRLLRGIILSCVLFAPAFSIIIRNQFRLLITTAISIATSSCIM